MRKAWDRACIGRNHYKVGWYWYTCVIRYALQKSKSNESLVWSWGCVHAVLYKKCDKKCGHRAGSCRVLFLFFYRWYTHDVCLYFSCNWTLLGWCKVITCILHSTVIQTQLYKANFVTSLRLYTACIHISCMVSVCAIVVSASLLVSEALWAYNRKWYRLTALAGGKQALGLRLFTS